MRTALLFLLALGVFLGGYFALAWLMPGPQSVAQRETSAVAPLLRQSQRIIGDIDGVTFRSHDTKTGAAVAEVRIGEYRRSSDEQVLLRSIEATILLGEGSGLVTLSAPTGTVELEAGVEEQDRITPETLGTADLARLKDVTVRWYGEASALARGPSAALLALRVDNLVYDNRGFSLFTDDTEIAGATVLADDVPVEVRGRDYDFDGYGLLMRWDAQTRRPMLVRVARGERLTIKTKRGFMPEKIVGSGDGKPWPDRGGPVAGLMLASLDRQSADRAVAHALASVVRQEAPRQLYRATMSQNLQAVQGGITKLEADLATVFFSAESVSFKQGAKEPGRRSTQPAAAPATHAVSEEPFEPITLYWKGGLLIEAIEPSDGIPALRSGDDMHLRLEGAPLVMREEGVEARGRRLDFAKLADELELSGDAQTPVTLVEAEGSTLVTNRLVARPGAGTARAPAAGYAEVISGHEALQLRWERECDFSFTKGSSGEQQLKSVEARGTVRVRHPEVSLDSEALDVTLVPAADGSNSPQLESVFAEEQVLCQIAGDEPTRFTSDRLRLTFEKGLDGPVTALAEGKVSSLQGGQHLFADALRVLLAPDEAAELQLVEMTATGNVHGSDDDGRTYRAEFLRATPLAVQEPGQPRRQDFSIRLEGVDARPAKVEMGDESLLGQALEFNSHDETVHVPGAGRIQTLQEGPGGRPLPLAVKWTGSMTGTRRQVDIAEGVELSGREEPTGDNPIGTDISFRSDSATILLKEPVVGKEAAGAPQVAADPATHPAELAGSVEKLILTGNLRATVEERLNDALLRSFDLRAEALEAWPAEQTARVEIPSPGRVLVRDLRPPLPGPPTTRPIAEGFRGNAAVEWKSRLEFDPESGLLRLLGGVTLAVEPVSLGAGAQQAGRTFRLDAEEAHVQTQRSADGRTEMKSATAAGQARFSTDGLSLEGGRIEFDPLSQRISARGEAGSPVLLFDGDGAPTGRFAEVVYNLQTGQIESLREVGAGG